MCNHQDTLEIQGYIKKEEHLYSLQNNILPNTLVLASQKAFPGYHGENLPDSSQPNSVFLLINNKYEQESIYRITKKIKTQFNYDFNACYGSLHFKAQNYNCIRIKHLSSINYLPELQTLYKEEFIKFVNFKYINAPSIITVNKGFLVCEKTTGIYQDLEEDSKCYFELPEQIDWEDFCNITADIKNNITSNNFDAAQGVFYRKKEIVDVVRIYDQDKNLEKMQKLQKMYNEKIKKL